MTGLPFIKMHGLGNDFVVLDARAGATRLSAAQVRAIADRRSGVGCDQLIVVGAASDSRADVSMRIRNADGGEVAACGNATRCVAAMLMEENGVDHAVIQTRAGLLDARAASGGLITVDMGRALTEWKDIPLANEVDTLRLDIEAGPLAGPCAVGMGNPHAVFFVDDAEAVDLETWGPIIENHDMFPERTNVEVAEVMGPNQIRMRVWERGVGITRACGTGACAALVAAHRREYSENWAEVILDGGSLRIEWLESGRVRMTGPVTFAFRGTIEKQLLSEDQA
ncbi:MAG: diaminopimelate epimerase [Rhodospirillales bacterium]|nr:diaminopimelate epimerase [Rhodospirillales bacterium]